MADTYKHTTRNVTRTRRTADAQRRPRAKVCRCCHRRKRLEAFIRSKYERGGISRSCAACIGANDGLAARLGLNAPLTPRQEGAGAVLASRQSSTLGK
jgi:hypothetical protein